MATVELNQGDWEEVLAGLRKVASEFDEPIWEQLADKIDEQVKEQW